MAAAPLGTKIEALQDFWCDELRSGYVTGLGYQVRVGCERLAELIPEWVKEGKVKIVVDQPGAVQPASVSGEATVS